MYILFILFCLYINVNGEQQHKQHAKLNHMPPDNVSYIIEEGDISDGNESIVLIQTVYVHSLTIAQLTFWSQNFK